MNWQSIRGDFLQCTIRFVVTRTLILAIGLICWSVFPQKGYSEQVEHLSKNVDLKKVWNKFDSVWYLHLATEGYPQRSFTDTKQEAWGFMPLYPFVMHWISKISGLDLFYAGLLLSNVMALFGLLFIYRLSQEKFQTGIDSVNYVLMCTGSFFLSIVYAEGLFFFLSALVFYFSNQKKYALAFIFAGLASVTRIQGCLLLLIPGIDIISNNFRNSYRYLPAALLGLVPMAIFMTYLYLTCGEPFAFIKIQHAWGSKETFPLQGFVNLAINNFSRPSAINASFWILILIAVFSQHRQLPLSYLVFTIGYFMLSTSNEVVYGTTRYIIGVIPLFLAVSVSSKNVKDLFVFINLLFLGITIATFVTHHIPFL